MSQKSPRQVGAQVFIAAMAVAALGCFCVALTHWQSTDPLKFLCYLGSRFWRPSQNDLPGINGTLSVNFLFILLGVLETELLRDADSGFRSPFWSKPFIGSHRT